MFDSDLTNDVMRPEEAIIHFTDRTDAGEKVIRDYEREGSGPRSTTDRDDALLVEIDAFRDKAKQLQGLINAKQERVNVLERLVADKEVQNSKLQEELSRRKRQADGLLADVESQMNRMEASVMHNMDSMEDRIRAQVSQIAAAQVVQPVAGDIDISALKETFDGQTQTLRSVFSENQDRLSVTLNEQQERMDASFFKQQKLIEESFTSQRDQIEQSLSGQQEKIDRSLAEQQERFETSFAEQQKRMEDSLSTLSNLGDIEIGTEKLEKLMEEQKGAITQSLDGQGEKLAAGFDEVRSDMSDMKDAIFEKIHSEDVKVYRNLQDYLQEQDHSKDGAALITKKFNTLRIFNILSIILTIINIAICVFFVMLIL